MTAEQLDYIKNMRQDGTPDDAIKKALHDNGWRDDEIETAFKAVNSGKPLPPPPPHAMQPNAPAPQQEPIAVVQRYTTAGMEYSIMFLALLFAATSLGSLLHAQLDKLYSPTTSSIDALPGVTALVTIPIFLVLFFRLRSKERSDDSIKADSSRRKGVQLTLLVSFAWGVGSVIFYLYMLFNSASLTIHSPLTDPVLQFLHLLITVAIAGSIFTYYWIDEHRHKM